MIGNIGNERDEYLQCLLPAYRQIDNTRYLANQSSLYSAACHFDDKVGEFLKTLPPPPLVKILRKEPEEPFAYEKTTLLGMLRGVRIKGAPRPRYLAEAGKSLMYEHHETSEAAALFNMLKELKTKTEAYIGVAEVYNDACMNARDQYEELGILMSAIAGSYRRYVAELHHSKTATQPPQHDMRIVDIRPMQQAFTQIQRHYNAYSRGDHFLDQGTHNDPLGITGHTSQQERQREMG